MVDGSSSTPPLQIVLGSLASDDTSRCAAEASARGGNSKTYILGTSAYPHLGSGLKLKIDGRVAMEDRKAPLSQFRPRSLLLSVSCLYSALLFILHINTHYIRLFHNLTTLPPIPTHQQLLLQHNISRRFELQRSMSRQLFQRISQISCNPNKTMKNWLMKVKLLPTKRMK